MPGISSNEVADRLKEKMGRELGRDVMSLLQEDNVVEVMLNPDGHIWVDRFGAHGGMEDTGIRMPVEQSLAFLGTVASYYGKTIHHSDTIIAEVFPLDGSRINGVIPPTTAMPSFNIRKRAKKIFTLDEYIEQGRMTSFDKKVISDGIRDRVNILIAGATGSGKTTFTNAVLHELNTIHPQHRIISMEDTEELQVPQNNKVRMFTDECTPMQKLLFSAMRQRPDRIIIGEVRDGAALDLLKSWNTGHPGGITTLHANSCIEALSRLEMLIMEAVNSPMQRLIGQAVGMVAFIEKTAAGPSLSQIMEVVGYDQRLEEYDVRWIKGGPDEGRETGAGCEMSVSAVA
jgi:type IV secretion system protein VirB11